VNKTVCVIGGTASHANAAAKMVGCGYATTPEIKVDGLVFECEHAYSNATYLYVSASDELAVVGVDCYDISLFGVAFDALYRAREYPGVEALQ
jgi:hypothetical protein